MSFKNTEQLLHNLNNSVTAKLPMLNDISANMKPYNINTSYTSPKELGSFNINLAIYKSIKELIAEMINGDVEEPLVEEPPVEKLLILSGLIKHITDMNLLFPTVRYLKELGLLKSLNQQLLDWHNRFFHNSLYSIDQYIRIDAMVCGTIMEYESKIMFHTNVLNGDFPELKFKVVGDFLFHNMDEISSELKRKMTIAIDEQIITHPPVSQIKIYKNIINSYNKHNYINESNYFKDEIEYFLIAKEIILDKEIGNAKVVIDTFPFINKKVFDFFKIYTKKYILEPIGDYSYLFQRLKKENLLINIKHLTFINWLKDNDFIKEKTHEKFLTIGSFRSLEKSYSDSRQNNYNILFEEIFT